MNKITKSFGLNRVNTVLFRTIIQKQKYEFFKKFVVRFCHYCFGNSIPPLPPPPPSG